MDNITHSLAGLIMGDAAVALRGRFGGASSPRFRAAALTTAVLASNLPDLDFLYTGITGGRLGYLLHHRGHTHTLAAAPPIALFCLALVALFFRLRHRELPRADVAALAALALVGSAFHVWMDFGNNYGVHPFWPLHDGWFYGDAIFIIEPWLMVALIGMALNVSRSRVLRGLLLLALAGLLGLAWTTEFMGPPLAAALTLLALGWAAALWRAPLRARWAAGGAALALLAAALLGTRHTARASVRQALEGEPEARLLDLSSTPMPGNPLCWSVLAVQVAGGDYVVRQGLASGWPSLSSAASCRLVSDGQTAPLAPVASPPGEAGGRRLVWRGEFRGPLAELEQLREGDCRARAFLRFARVPFWLGDGERAELIGDLRFDRSSALEFAELPLRADPPCPRFVPPWEPPLGLPPPPPARGDALD